MFELDIDSEGTFNAQRSAHYIDETAWAGSFLEGLASEKKDGLWGFVNRAGQFALPPQFEVAQFFSEGLAVVQMDHKLGFVGRL